MTDDGLPNDDAVETSEATDTDSIKRHLPDDIAAELTGRAFSPGTIRELIRDCYYMGPLGIGSGGWRGIFGSGRPGTQLRRPDGAFYNFPRSWRYAALERALKTGIITHIGNGHFATTERGVALLNQIDRCPDCDRQREPQVKSTYYIGNPHEEGHIESHSLVTRCPECAGSGYNYGNSSTSYSEYERDEDSAERARQRIANTPQARIYPSARPIDPDAITRSPDADMDEIHSLLDRVVKEQADPTPREIFQPETEGLYGREIQTEAGTGTYYQFAGDYETITVTRTDEQGDIHLSPDPQSDPSENRVKVGMGYKIAVEYGYKDHLHHDAEDADWNGDYWTVGREMLNRVLSKLTLGSDDGETAFPDADDYRPPNPEYFTVTVDPDVVEQAEIPLFGLDEDNTLL